MKQETYFSNRAPHFRDTIWYIAFYLGFIIYAISSFVLSGSEKDQPAWYGTVDMTPKLYATEEAAIADNATNVENVHAKFNTWLITAGIVLILVMIMRTVFDFFAYK